LQIIQIIEQILSINGEAVAEGRWLGRLNVGVGHDREFGRFFDALGEVG
jgi:hypothetical protein